VHVCPPSAWLDVMFGKLRNEATSTGEFRNFSSLLGDYLLVEAINQGFVPLNRNVECLTPTGARIAGTELADVSSIIAVPIVRAGNAFTDSVLRLLSPEIAVGQLVIQRDEETALPKTILEKLPNKLADAQCVLILDPMLATGGSIVAAINVLKDKGVCEDRIVVLHALGCPEGIEALKANFKEIKVVIGVVDSHLNEKKFIVPGLGDFGDRFYGF
jgi:uracil phosphoribosyltransferase